MTTHRVASENDLAPGSVMRCELFSRDICLARTENGEFYAVDDDCPHEEAWLSEGDLNGFEIECPMHYSRFDLRTGEVRCLPAKRPVETFATEIREGAVYVTVPG